MQACERPPVPHYKELRSMVNRRHLYRLKGACWVILAIDTLDLFVGNVNRSENAIQQDIPKSTNPAHFTC